MAKTNNNDINKQLYRLRRNKRILWLAILFFVLVALWILLSIFSTTKASSSITAEQRELAKSFVPRLESKVFDEISGERFFSDDELSSFPIYVFDSASFDGKQELIDIINKPEESIFAEKWQETQTPASESATLETNLEASESSNVL